MEAFPDPPTSSNENGWLKYLENTPSCRFPASGRVEPGPVKDTRGSISIQPQSGGIRELQSKEEISNKLRIFEVAWAFVLRCYVGSDSVAFVFQILSERSREAQVFQTDFGQETSWREALARSEGEVLPCLGKDDDAGTEAWPAFEKVAADICSTSLVLATDPAVRRDVDPSPGRFEIELTVGLDSDDGLHLGLAFQEDIINKDQANNIAGTFIQVTNRILDAGLDSNIWESDLVDESQHTQIAQWNSSMPLPSDVLVHEVIRAQALQSPHREAVCSWDGKLTFHQLEDYSSRLAGQLRNCGVQRGSFVPFCFEKSVWTVIAMMATLKAGGAMVPLDPAYPVERFKEIIQQTKATVVLTSKGCQSLFPFFNASVVDRESLERYPHWQDQGRISGSRYNATDPAYVYFTSGSTGRPKGVVILHESFTLSIVGCMEKLKIDSSTRMLQFASYTFDPSLMEIFSPLYAGGCVCVPAPDQRTTEIAEVMINMRVNSAFFTPTFLKMVDPQNLPKLKSLLVGGEALNEQCIAEWAENTYAVNGYGPTECCIMCTAHHIKSTSENPSNIGKAFNCLSWIVEKENANKLMPVGAVGELLLQGPIVFDGYLGDPALTREALVQDPPWCPSDTPKSLRKAYKTGDLVRYGPGGELIYVGRKDHQVKVRGQRVELGEIEQNILKASQAPHVTVLLPKIGPYRNRLVAVVATDASPATGSTTHSNIELLDGSRAAEALVKMAKVQASISEHLPQYMVPAAWVAVAALPVSLAGKTARKLVQQWLESIDDLTYHRLMDLDSTNMGAGPLSQTEVSLSKAWANVLNLDPRKIGAERSFLNLGGDSIMAMQVASACRAEGLFVKVTDVLVSQNLVELASRTEFSVPELALKVEQPGTPFGLTPIQRIHFLLSTGLEDCFGQKFSLKLNKHVEARKLEQGIRYIIERHSMLRVRFSQSESSEWTQTISEDIEGSYQFRISYTDKCRIDVNSTESIFDIRRGPLLVAHVIRNNSESTLLDLFCHHLIVDLVSWRIILTDLEDFLLSKNLEKPDPVSFQTLQALQQRQGPSQAVECENPVVLSKIPPADAAYWALSHEENICGGTESISFQLNESQTSQLISGCHKALNSEPLDVLLASLAVSFNNAFPDRDVPIVFNESHGRDLWDQQIDTSQTVGWFTTLYPVDITIENNTSLVDAVRHAKDARHHSVKRSASDGFNLNSVFDGGNSQCEILFNFMGSYKQFERADALWSMERGSGMDFGSSDLRRWSIFDVSVIVENDRASFSIAYNRCLRDETRIRNWIRLWEDCVEQTTQALTQAPRQHTLSDFPLAEINYDDLKHVESVVTKYLEDPLANIETICPASPMQRAMLLSQQKSPAYYHSQFFLRVTSVDRPIDILRLHKAWTMTVRRHAMLRTIFIERKTTPTYFDQIVLTDWEPAVVTLRHAGTAESLEDILDKRHFHEDGRPPHMLTIIEWDAEIMLYFEISHTISDYRSATIYQRDLALAYDGQLPITTAPPYYDLAVHLKAQEQRTAFEYWEKYLHPIPTCLFPVQQHETAGPGKLHSVSLKVTQAIDLHTSAQSSSVTIPTFMRLAWGLTLRRRLDHDQVCFGYVVSGRDVPVPDIDEVAGPLISILPCRQELTRDLPIQCVLRQVQLDFADGVSYQHDALPAMNALEPRFNTIVNCRKENLPESLKKGGIRLEFVAEIDPFDYDIVLEIDEVEEAVHTKLSYWSNKLSAADASEILREYHQILSTLIRMPHGTVQDAIEDINWDLLRI